VDSHPDRARALRIRPLPAVARNLLVLLRAQESLAAAG